VSNPIRRCVGCGRRAAQPELVRFAAREGRLVSVSRGGGRSAYTCRRLSCFERAVSHRGFNRTLRANVQVDPALTRLYTGGADG
jgi:predicted RNA-binding protein YlxR (DUF448 family)